MRLAAASSALLLLAVLGGCAAFQVAAPAPAHRFGVDPATFALKRSALLSATARLDDGGDVDNVDGEGSPDAAPRTLMLRERARTFGQLLSERMDTMGAAGFYDDNEDADDEDALEGQPMGRLSRREWRVPMQAGIVKTCIQIAIVVFVARKWRQIISQDKMLKGDSITQAEDAQLHAWTCNNCGATLYIAKGKEWRYFPKNYKCYLCGNQGRENFTDTRTEIIERVGDDYEFLDPWEALSKKEQRKLLKECGGDEVKAQELAIKMAAEAAGLNVKETKPAAEDLIAEVAGTEGGEEGESEEGKEAAIEQEGEESASAIAEEESASPVEKSVPAPVPMMKKKSPPKKLVLEDDNDGLDALDMDAL